MNIYIATPMQIFEPPTLNKYVKVAVFGFPVLWHSWGPSALRDFDLSAMRRRTHMRPSADFWCLLRKS